MEGWIKVHRKILNWEWYKHPNMTHLFQYLLLTANHQKRKWKGIDIQRGQVITGRNTISTNTGISPQSVRTCLDRLKSTNEITIKSTNKYSIITITNYEDYQIKEDTVNQQINQQNHQQSTSSQPQTRIIKKDKNKEKEEEKEIFIAKPEEAPLFIQDNKFLET
jgi:DNA replication protein DnaD